MNIDIRKSIINNFKEANEKEIGGLKARTDTVENNIILLTDAVDTLKREVIKEIIINDLPATVQENLATLLIGAKDIKLTEYQKSDKPGQELRNTDTINDALGKLNRLNVEFCKKNSKNHGVSQS